MSTNFVIVIFSNFQWLHLSKIGQTNIETVVGLWATTFTDLFLVIFSGATYQKLVTPT